MFRAPRGTQDILPEDQPYWQHVYKRIQRIAQLYGFQQIDVPIFEDTRLFVRGVGEGADLVVQKEMYSFEDKGGDHLTLRPEFTAGVMRAYIEHGMHVLPPPVRLFSLGPVFRQERPQAGRYRIHHQFNVEALGETDPALDVEVMSVAWQLYTDLGFRSVAFQLNSTGCPACRPAYVNVLVDYFSRYVDQMDAVDRTRLERNPLRLLDSKEEKMQSLIEDAPRIEDYLCDDCREHFATLRADLDELDRPYSINHRLVRGLDYYTKTVFEVWAEGIGAQAAVCGGGRYDGLVEALGGPPTPGIGFGSGIERIILAMKAMQVPVPPLPGPEVMVLYLGQDTRRAALRVADRLRSADLAALLPYRSSLKAQLKAADRAGVRFAVIVGEDELARNLVAARDMRTGEQDELPFDGFVNWLRERLDGQI